MATHKKPEKIKRLRVEEPNEEPPVKLETMFEARMVKRLKVYKKDHGFLKMQEVIRVAVGYFLQKQGY